MGADSERAARFLGDWRDASGRVLRVLRAGDALAVSLVGADGFPLRRRGLTGPPLPTVDLGAALDGDALVVELGAPGLGPTLRLAPGASARGEPMLLPELRAGLYDDLDDDLGAPFVLPLTPYRRA